MLNALATEEAMNSLTYVLEGTKEEKLAITTAYGVQVSEIEAKFADYLADKYASDLSSTAQALLWSKSCSDGNGSGYYEIEYHYCELAEFAKKIILFTAN